MSLHASAKHYYDTLYNEWLSDFPLNSDKQMVLIEEVDKLCTVLELNESKDRIINEVEIKTGSTMKRL